MKTSSPLLFALLALSCSDTHTVAPPPQGQIVVYVHWEEQALADKQIELVETGETKFTDVTGTATFAVPPGKYTIRAFAINRGGPALRSIDFDVEVRPGATTRLDIVDCLPCLEVQRTA